MKPTPGSEADNMNGHLSKSDFFKYMDEFKTGLNTKFTEIQGDVSDVDKSVGIVINELKHHKEHIDGLENKFSRWNFINSIGVVAGTIIGSLMGTKK